MYKAGEVTKVFFGKISGSSKWVGKDNKYDFLSDLFLIYSSAIKEISTKLEILDGEFQIKRKRNPIEHMKSRVKSPESVEDKLRKKGKKFTIENARSSLCDIAGIRVVCSFVSDIYEVAKMLKCQNDLIVIEEVDYIKNPKVNGYRSLHLVLEVPVFFSSHTDNVRVEVQIRTIAMDFWASLEHKLRYKVQERIPRYITDDLKACADVISLTDERMQRIHDALEEYD